MGKLQYDSFYKFIVSVGFLLIVAPVFLLHFWMSGIYDLAITQQNLEALAPSAAELLSMKMDCVNMVLSKLPIIFICVEAVGVGLFIWGCYKWYSIQKYLDSISELDVKEKNIRLKQMTPEEKLQKITEEANEEAEEMKAADKASDVIEVKANEGEERYKDKIALGLEVEKLYFDRLKREIGSNYQIRRNVKLDKFEYDIIARSRVDNIDIIYEIKHWDKAVPQTLLDRTCVRMEAAEVVYENLMHRNKRSILVIISNAAAIERMKKQEIEKTVVYKFRMGIEFIEENSLS